MLFATVGESTSQAISRSEEHTSELQSQSNLVCRLLLEKKKKKQAAHPPLPLPSRPAMTRRPTPVPLDCVAPHEPPPQPHCRAAHPPQLYARHRWRPLAA